MALLQRLELRQGQTLVMTPQLLQAIKLLQLSHLDLAAYVEAEFERNPLLERPDSASAEPAAGEAPAASWTATELGSDGTEPLREFGAPVAHSQDSAGVDRAALSAQDLAPFPVASWTRGGPQHLEPDASGLEASLAGQVSLREHLEQQLDVATADPRERVIGRHLIGAIDEAGYLADTVEDVAARLGASEQAVERVLALLHTFDPPGIAARSLAECLAIQLRDRNRYDPAMQALLCRLDLVAKRDIPALQRLCGLEEEDIAEMLREIRSLEPKPGRAFGGAPVQVLVPDVAVRAAPDGSWIVELNPETLPRVLVNQSYYAHVSKVARSDGEKAFLSDCLQNASWLARSLEQRAKTILKVATEIVRQQDGFFRYGVAHLRPLNLKTVAEAVGMHESTVSRVTSNKSMVTGRGLFEMKYFFTAAISGAPGAEAHSSEAVRHRIKQLIDTEDPRDILSDDALVQKLKREGVAIARRTVAKYRESLRIPSSVERRRAKETLGASRV